MTTVVDVEVFGNQRLPEAAEMVRARLVALFQPAFPAEDGAAEPIGEPSAPPGDAAAGHLRLDDAPARWRLTKRHIAVMAALSLVAVVVSVGWMLRARAVPIAVAVPDPARASSASESSVPSTQVPEAAGPVVSSTKSILVHVVGAVVNPGVVTLAQGARVTDAIAAAGGLRADADPAELNLAAVLADGSQVVIGTKGSPRGEVRAGQGGAQSTSGPASSGGQIDLNTATIDQLDTLPGVGPVLAQAIIDYRTRHGRFTKIEELQEVDGIGTKTYAQIAPHVRV